MEEKVQKTNISQEEISNPLQAVLGSRKLGTKRTTGGRIDSSKVQSKSIRICKKQQEYLEEGPKYLQMNPNFPDNRKIDLETKNFFSKFFLSFLYKIIKTGSKQPYQEQMLYKVGKNFIYSQSGAIFAQKVNDRKLLPNPLTLSFLMKSTPNYFLKGFLFTFLAYLSQIIIPLYMKNFIDWLTKRGVEGHRKDLFEGFYYAGIMGFMMFLKALFLGQGNLNISRSMVHINNLIGVRERAISQLEIVFTNLGFFFHFLHNFLDFYADFLGIFGSEDL